MMLAIYRIGYHVPIPGVNQEGFRKLAENQGQDGSAAGRLANYVSLFSGGNLSQSTIFGLGVMPYISSSIIFQLLGTVVPTLEKMQKEGETGRKKIQEWTRYATVPLCIVQAMFWLTFMHNSRPRLVQEQFANTVSFWIMGITCLTAGCVFLMWLGEQIDEYGLGNGVSLIILAGIVARMPQAIVMLGQMANFSTAAREDEITVGKIVFLTANMWDYGTQVARLVPNRFHARIVKNVEGRAEEDTFPTAYRTNTSRDVTRLADSAGLKINSFEYLNQYPNYLMFNGFLFFLGMCYERLTSRFEFLRFLRGWIMVTLEKPSAVQKN
jgi:hypothetical protein